MVRDAGVGERRAATYSAPSDAQISWASASIAIARCSASYADACWPCWVRQRPSKCQFWASSASAPTAMCRWPSGDWSERWRVAWQSQPSWRYTRACRGEYGV